VTDEKIGSETQNEQQQDTDEPLREPGKRALEDERRARRSAEKALQAAQAKIAEFERGDLLREVASEKGLTVAQARRLQGDTKEELLSDADDLLESFGTKDDVKPSSSRPKERLRSGAASDEEPGPDMGSVAESILS
jgi:hypothetical protein